MRALVASVAALAALLCAALAGSGQVAWRSIGPGQFGAMFGPGFSPHDSKVIVAGVDMGNAFMTRDGGKTWKILGRSGGEPFGNPGYRGMWGVHFDPQRPERIWIGSQHGLYRTTDGGENWQLVLGGDPTYDISAITSDPTNPDIVYAGSGRGAGSTPPWSPGNVWKSVDGGQTWRVLRPSGPDQQPTRGWATIAVDPQSPFTPGQGHSRVYVCGSGGFFVSEDAGDTWTCLEEFLPGGKVNLTPGDSIYTSGISTLVLTPGEERATLFATIRPRPESQGVGGVYASYDGGKTWVGKNKGLEEAIASMNRDFSYSLLVGCRAQPKVMYWGCQDGVFKTEDGGETWSGLLNLGTDWYQAPDPDGQQFVLRTHNSNFDQSFYNAYGPANGLACSATDPNAVAYTDNAGIAVSFDGGKRWTEPGFEFGEAVWPGEFGDRPPMVCTHKVRSRGIQLIVPIDAAVDPFDPQTIAIGHCDIGLMISRDGGTWWEWAYHGILGGEKNYIRAVLYDPGVKGRMWAAGGGWGQTGHVYQSDDGGRTFELIGIPQLSAEAERSEKTFFVYALALDPTSPQDARTLYAGTESGLYKTTDGGQAWQALAFGLGSTPVVPDLCLDPTKPTRLYAGVEASPEETGLYRSDDAGMSWQRLGADRITDRVVSISVCQATGTLYVLAARREGGTALWRSDDHGDTWQEVDERLAACAAVHPQDPNRVYLVVFTMDVSKEKVNVYRSTDGGRHWEAIGDDIPISPWYGYNKIVFDPSNPSRFLLLHNSGTYEGIEK